MAVSYKSINKLAFPAIAAGIVESVLALTDMLVVGRLDVDTIEAVAAVGLVGTILSSFIWVFAQSQNALSTIVSQHLGADKLSRAYSLVPQTLMINLLAGILVVIIGISFSYPILSWFRADGLLMEYSQSYWNIRIIGFPITLLAFVLFGAFRGVQNTYWAFLCSLTGAILNAILTVVLVFGIEDWIPAMHVQGAAISSVISQSVILLMAIYFYVFKSPLKFSISFKPHPGLKRFLALSFDFILRTASLNLAMYVANRMATTVGDAYMATHALIMNLWMFFAFFLDGYAHAGNAMGGRFLGEKNYDAIFELSRKIGRASILLAFLIIGLCSVTYYWIPLAFTSDEEIISLFRTYFWLALLIQPINGLAFAYDGIYKGLGLAKRLRNNIVIATFIGFIPVSYITFHFGWGMYAIWAGFYVWMFIRSYPLKWGLKKAVLNE